MEAWGKTTGSTSIDRITLADVRPNFWVVVHYGSAKEFQESDVVFFTEKTVP